MKRVVSLTGRNKKRNRSELLINSKHILQLYKYNLHPKNITFQKVFIHLKNKHLKVSVKTPTVALSISSPVLSVT